MKAYRVYGNFLMGTQRQNFVKEVASENEKHARDMIFSLIGSKHKVKRRNITIEKIEEIAAVEVVDSIVRYKIGTKT